MNQKDADKFAQEILVALVATYPGDTAVRKIGNCIDDLRSRFDKMKVVTSSDRAFQNMLFDDIQTLERIWAKARGPL